MKKVFLSVVTLLTVLNAQASPTLGKVAIQDTASSGGGGVRSIGYVMISESAAKRIYKGLTVPNVTSQDNSYPITLFEPHDPLTSNATRITTRTGGSTQCTEIQYDTADSLYRCGFPLSADGANR